MTALNLGHLDATCSASEPHTMEKWITLLCAVTNDGSPPVLEGHTANVVHVPALDKIYKYTKTNMFSMEHILYLLLTAGSLVRQERISRRLSWLLHVWTAVFNVSPFIKCLFNLQVVFPFCQQRRSLFLLVTRRAGWCLLPGSLLCILLFAWGLGMDSE